MPDPGNCGVGLARMTGNNPTKSLPLCRLSFTVFRITYRCTDVNCFRPDGGEFGGLPVFWGNFLDNSNKAHAPGPRRKGPGGRPGEAEKGRNLFFDKKRPAAL